MSNLTIYLLGEDDQAKKTLMQYLSGKDTNSDCSITPGIVPTKHTFVSQIGEVFSTTVFYTPGGPYYIDIVKKYIHKADVVCYVFDLEDHSQFGKLLRLLEVQRLHHQYGPLQEHTTPVIIGLNQEESPTRSFVNLKENQNLPVFQIALKRKTHLDKGYQALFEYIVQIHSLKGRHDFKEDPNYYYKAPFKQLVLYQLNQLIKKQKSTIFINTIFHSEKLRKKRRELLIALRDRIEHTPSHLIMIDGIYHFLCDANPAIRPLLTPLIRTLENSLVKTPAQASTVDIREDKKPPMQP